MAIVLIFPPFVPNQSGPPAGLSALGPYLTQNGLDCRLLDLNIEFFWRLWNDWPRVAEAVRERLERRLASEHVTSSAARQFYHLLRLTLPLLDQCRSRYDRAPENYTSDVALFLQQSVANVMNAYYFDDVFVSGGRLEITLDELARRVRDRVEDALLDDFLSGYNWSSFDLAGFSLLSQSQLPFAMLFASALRAKLDRLRTVAGGAYVTEMIGGLASERETFNYFDFLVLHEGESALLQIAAGDGRRIEHPNVVGPGQDLSARSFLVEDIDTLPEQDFSQFPMDLYRPRGVSLPLYSSKGCSWGRCAFCSVNFLRYRERDAELFFNTAQRAALATGVRSIQLVDEDVPPERLRRLAEMSLAAGSEQRLEWFLQTRFYPGLDRELLGMLAKAGFSTIEFGLESADKHTLKIVKKGISLHVVQRILSDCEEVGIKVILNFMIGFPWETEAAGQQALDFIDDVVRRHPGLDLSCNTQEVKVYVHSDLHRTPEHYGISSSDALPLSPTTRWENPEWVADFVRRHRHHLLFSRRSSPTETVITEAKPLSTVDPRIELAPYWYHLPVYSAPMAIEEWGSGPLLVKASDGIADAFRVNSTLETVLAELGDGRRVSDLREGFLDRFPHFDRGEKLGVLGDALVMLNQMGALSFHSGQSSV
jgi:anaerobic magnesium-protoporphyrin IX monomethyl ester cyclase